MKNPNETIKRVLRDESNVRDATAPFQADFPYERDEEAQVTRREFCNFLGLTSAALLLGAAGFGAKAALDARESESFGAARVNGAETLALNSSLNFAYPTAGDSAILIRTSDGAYHAYGQKCTHLSCPVYYSRNHQRLECPCHEGAFDAATGKVLYGPPPRPLDAVDLELRGEQVWAINRRAPTDEPAS
ncbi:MAG TPA: Rieske (2Fe-2S) protein [Pyrinomonadaceae bacterium]